eukprot:TRINITY_DN104050_c0_g1_i1.p1 TRINITY_DN104050_c0_g1~~TRINITY_DN104050_c0_g1_i1.p1  ORF type:complete len:476 (+),score=81.23 TRINITY_DN104050_c0_g1_i1:89-1429(+)
MRAIYDRRKETQGRISFIEKREKALLEDEKRKFGNKVKREPQADNDEDQQASKKARLVSQVAVPKEARPAAKDAPVVRRPRHVPHNPDQRRRDRRLFGVVMGVLSKSKQDLDNSNENARRKEEKLKAVGDRLQEQQEQQRLEGRRKLEADKNAHTTLLNSLHKRYEQLQRAYHRMITEERDVLFSHFLETTGTKPKIYYLPSHHNHETRKKVEERKKNAQEKYQKFREQLNTLLADLNENGMAQVIPQPKFGGGRGGPGQRWNNASAGPGAGQKEELIRPPGQVRRFVLRDSEAEGPANRRGGDRARQEREERELMQEREKRRKVEEEQEKVNVDSISNEANDNETQEVQAEPTATEDQTAVQLDENEAEKEQDKSDDENEKADKPKSRSSSPEAEAEPEKKPDEAVEDGEGEGDGDAKAGENAEGDADKAEAEDNADKKSDDGSE